MAFFINPRYESEEYKSGVASIFSENVAFQPFPYLELVDLLPSTDPLAGLRSELGAVKWNTLENDMYSLEQTDDLENLDVSKFPKLSEFRNFMATVIKKWLEEVSGIVLDDKVAITGSQYSSTHCLLPHDDRLEDRIFAFAFYISPDWSAGENGGELCLFSSDAETNCPTEISKKIVPKENTMSLFRVQHNSWHSVAEVFGDRKRLSLNGWFHCSTSFNLNSKTGRELIPEKPAIRLSLSKDIQMDEACKWIRPEYFLPEEKKRVKRIFANKSELSLSNFLKPEKYNQVLDELESFTFESVGPPNKRSVGRIDPSKLPAESATSNFLKILQSEAMAKFLSQWTGLKLCYRAVTKNEGGGDEEASSSEPPSKITRTDIGPSATNGRSLDDGNKESNSNEDSQKEVKVSISLEKYQRGSYSMADDQQANDSTENGFCFDVTIFFGKDTWPEENGGFIVYFVAGEKDEMLRITPVMNTAALVFREPEILNFKKYINHKAKENHFFVVQCSYFVLPDDDDYDDEEEEEEESEEGSAGGNSYGSLDDDEGSLFDEEVYDQEENLYEGGGI